MGEVATPKLAMVLEDMVVSLQDVVPEGYVFAGVLLEIKTGGTALLGDVNTETALHLFDEIASTLRAKELS